jgi:putative hydrolase of HD superfamily
MLKRVKRSGWWMTGIPVEESVAEHSFRCACLGYVLARAEGVDPYKVLLMSLFGDMPEARINDQHKVAASYLNVREAESRAFRDQIKDLPHDIKEELETTRSDYEAQGSREALVARDADILECLLQAKEYSDLGFKEAEKFFRKAPEHLKTRSARDLWENMKGWASNSWWEGLTSFER